MALQFQRIYIGSTMTVRGLKATVFRNLLLTHLAIQEAKTEAQKLMEEAEALMKAMASGDYKPPKQKAAPAPEAMLADATQQPDPSTELRLHCDVNGCVIIPLSAKQPTHGLSGAGYYTLVCWATRKDCLWH